MSTANEKYIIDIAAEMPAGEQTLEELDALTSQLVGAGASASEFQRAVVSLSNGLNLAKAASEAANAALAAGNDEYSALEKAANAAAKAAEKEALKGAVSPETATAAQAASDAVNAYATTLAKLEQDAKDAATSEDKLGTSLKNVRKLTRETSKAQKEAERIAKEQAAAVSDAAKKAEDAIKAQADAQDRAARESRAAFNDGREGLNKFGGALGGLSSRILGPIEGFRKLSGSLGTGKTMALLATGAVVALTVAVIAAAVAFAAGVVAVAQWAVGLADSARNAGLAKEAMEAMHPELIPLGREIDSISKDTGMMGDELRELSGALKEAKVSAKDMPAALRAAALAETALGKGGSGDFLKDIKEGKVAVADLASETQKKLGGIVARQMMGLGAQTETLKRNIGGVFGGLDIQPVLNGMQTLVALFDQNTASGRAMKAIFESVFQPLISQAENAGYVIEAFVLGFEIGLVKLYIKLKPAIKKIQELFGFEDTNLWDTLNDAKALGETLAPVFVAMAAAFVVVTAAVFAVVGAFGALFVFFEMLPFMVVDAVAALLTSAAKMAVNIKQAITQGIADAIDYVRSIDFAQVGRDIIAGFVRGVTESAHFVKESVSRAIQGAIDAAKHLLDSHSPSRVFMDLGGDTAEGYAIGVDDTAEEAHAAVENLVSPLSAQDALSGNAGAVAPAKPAASPAATPPASAGLNLAGAVFHFYGVEGAEDSERRFSEVLTRLIEGDAAQLGGATPA